jgi:hypothetical protein
MKTFAFTLLACLIGCAQPPIDIGPDPMAPKSTPEQRARQIRDKLDAPKKQTWDGLKPMAPPSSGA